MRAVAGLLLFVGGAHAASSGSASDISPIQKVIGMLNEMLQKGQSEKQDEQVTFAAYKQFCDSTKAQKKADITKGKELIEKLNADIIEADSDAARLAKEITQADADLAAWTAERDAKQAIRAKEKKDYDKTAAEYMEGIASIDGALEQVKAAASATVPEPGALIELSSQTWGKLPDRARHLLMSFLQFTGPEAALLQGKAKAKETERGQVVDLVKGLADKFGDEKSELDRAEAEGAGNFDLMIGDLLNQIENGSEQRERNSASKLQREQDKANAEGDLKDTMATRAQDEEFLKNLQSECETNSADYEQRQVARAGEITAIKKAIEIMSSPEVAGAGAKHGVASLDQREDQAAMAGLQWAQSDPLSFAQLRSFASGPVQSAVAGFLRDRALMANSQVLSLVASKTAGQPMKKITKMIRDMVQKLMTEAAEEAEHKAFCDTEMGTNKFTRDQKTEDSAELTATLEELSADIAKLSEESAALSASIAEIDATMAKATAERAAEKEKNTQTIAEAGAAQKGTAQALQVLKDYYENAATAASLTQLRTIPIDQASSADYEANAKMMLDSEESQGKSLMQTGEPYTGMSGGGVVGMLEVIESDFARLLAETTSSEAEGEKLFKKLATECDKNKAVKSTNLKHEESEMTKKETKAQVAKKDLKTTTEELDAALAYFEKLKPSCVDAGVSYEDRTARRKEEIESLKEALKILEDQ